MLSAQVITVIHFTAAMVDSKREQQQAQGDMTEEAWVKWNPQKVLQKTVTSIVSKEVSGETGVLAKKRKWPVKNALVAVTS